MPSYRTILVKPDDSTIEMPGCLIDLKEGSLTDYVSPDGERETYRIITRRPTWIMNMEGAFSSDVAVHYIYDVVAVPEARPTEGSR